MKLCFLGTGTSSGVPMIGCSCTVCNSKDPHDNRKRCAALLTFNATQILIDVGPDIRSQILDNHIQHIDAVLLTHSHYDHMIGLDELRPFSWKQPIPLYADSETIKRIGAVFSYIFHNPTPYKKGGLTRFDPHTIHHFQQFTYNDITITPLPIFHGNIVITGYKINNLAYISDAKSISDETIKQIIGVHTLVLGCLRKEQHPTHFNLEEALETIAIVKPAKCYLIHMNHEISSKQWEQLLPQNVYPAYDGLNITIPNIN